MHFTLPCTTYEAEHNFSALRHIKNYLLSTTTQSRLNSCCLLNIHSNMTDNINVKILMDVWIYRGAVRINTFR